MESISKFILPGILLLSTFAFGLWLSRLGKPYNGILFNIHKLAALGMVIWMAIQTNSILQGANVRGMFIGLAATCVVCVIALFATGAFMSIGNLSHAPLLTIHKIAFALLPFAAAGMVYSLAGAIR
jgi:hypothetical protein